MQQVCSLAVIELTVGCRTAAWSLGYNGTSIGGKSPLFHSCAASHILVVQLSNTWCSWGCCNVPSCTCTGSGDSAISGLIHASLVIQINVYNPPQSGEILQLHSASQICYKPAGRHVSTIQPVRNARTCINTGIRQLLPLPRSRGEQQLATAPPH